MNEVQGLKRKNVDKIVEQIFRHHLLDLELEIGVPVSVYVYSKSDWEGKYSVTPLFRSINVVINKECFKKFFNSLLGMKIFNLVCSENSEKTNQF